MAQDFLEETKKAFPQINEIEIKPDRTLGKIFVSTDCEEPQGLVDYIRMHANSHWRVEWRPLTS